MAYLYMIIIGNFEIFHYFNFETNFLKKRKPFLKNWSTFFQLKVRRRKTSHLHTKLPCQKPILRQIEWRVQNGSITKSEVLTLTRYFVLFLSFNFSVRVFINSWFYPSVHIHTFHQRWVLFKRALSLSVSLTPLDIVFKSRFWLKLQQNCSCQQNAFTLAQIITIFQGSIYKSFQLKG